MKPRQSASKDLIDSVLGTDGILCSSSARMPAAVESRGTISTSGTRRNEKAPLNVEINKIKEGIKSKRCSIKFLLFQSDFLVVHQRPANTWTLSDISRRKITYRSSGSSLLQRLMKSYGGQLKEILFKRFSSLPNEQYRVANIANMLHVM